MRERIKKGRKKLEKAGENKVMGHSVTGKMKNCLHMTGSAERHLSGFECCISDFNFSEPGLILQLQSWKQANKADSENPRGDNVVVKPPLHIGVEG